jgi:hypothetical protein
MADKINLAIYILVSAGAGYFITICIFDILLRGFAPFLPSRPWVIDKILDNLKLKKYRKIYSFGSGKSGFLMEFERLFPEAEIVGIEMYRFAYIMARLQLFLRKFLGHRTKIKAVRQSISRANISDAEIIYNHLYPEEMAGLGKKIKFECRPGTVIVSNGFLIPELEPQKFITLDAREGRFSWLSRQREIFKSKRKRSVIESRVYFYEI